jgi:purine-binding chemotaxis protein CheW
VSGIPARPACKKIDRVVRYLGRTVASRRGGQDGDDFASIDRGGPNDRRSLSASSTPSPIAPGSAAMFAGARNANAAEAPSRRGDNPVIQLVGFRLDNEDYAIAITKIQEIILMKPITRIPQVPDFIEGLINLRGSVIPIVNLRKRFGLPAREVDDETRTIVVNVHDKTVGCIVDAVTQVMRINRDQIQPPPLSVLSVAHQYLSGLARLEDRLLIILDIDRLFDEQNLEAVS